MIKYLGLILSVPLGFALATITKDEKQIYSKNPYFPIALWILAFATIISYIVNKQIALTLGFVFIMTFVWNRA